MNFSPLSPFMWARVVKKYPSETVGNTFSPDRPGLTGEKVPTLSFSHVFLKTQIWFVNHISNGKSVK